jgi:hypothetical protein
LSAALRLLISAAAVLSLSSSAVGEPVTISRIQGEWRVYKSGLADPEGVQAYGDEQLRAIVGNKLVISHSSVRWLISHGRAALGDVTGPDFRSKNFAKPCLNPTIQDKGRGRFNVRCGNMDGFGPADGQEPNFSVLRNGALKLDWWDGLVVYLRKQK